MDSLDSHETQLLHSSNRDLLFHPVTRRAALVLRKRRNRRNGFIASRRKAEVSPAQLCRMEISWSAGFRKVYNPEEDQC